MTHIRFARTERFLSLAIKYSLLIFILTSVFIFRPVFLREKLFSIFLGVLILGDLLYTYIIHKGLAKVHGVLAITLSICLDVLSISLVYCIFSNNRLFPIVFLFFLLVIFRLTTFYASASEFLMVVCLSWIVFLITIAFFEFEQLLLVTFWMYFIITSVILALWAVFVNKFLDQFGQSTKNYQLILQALQMVTSLVEMVESTAHYQDKNRIFQKAVEIIFRFMDINSCVAWIYQDNMLYPVASEGLEIEQRKKFNEMKFSTCEIPVFDRILTRGMPLMITKNDIEELVPQNYWLQFDTEAMLAIPLANKKRKLGCIALHWSTSSSKVTPQELAILSGIATQIGITMELIYLLDELREKEEIRGRLLEQVISIQESERERIARELHDETGQILTALMVNLEILKTEPEFQINGFQDKLSEISSLLRKSMEDIHDLSFDLHPRILSELGLVPAIKSYAKRHLERLGIDFNVNANNLNHLLTSKEEINLFRIAQEAITNIIRHAQARKVDIEIRIDAENVFLNIKDDGKGFDVKDFLNSQNRDKGLGLKGMLERVSFLNGQIDIKSKIGEGTEIFVNIPLQKGSDI